MHSLYKYSKNIIKLQYKLFDVSVQAIWCFSTSYLMFQYKLLLYVSKQQQITHADINVNFHFAVSNILL